LVTRNLLLAIAWTSIAVALLAARPSPQPGPFLRDFEAYWAAGSAQIAHQDPYGRAIWKAERDVPGVERTRDEILPFVNPPATLAAWRLFARLPYGVAAACWWAILFASLLGLVAAVLYAGKAPIGPASFFAALAVAIGFGPITSDLALGQIALPAFLGAVLVAIIAERSLPAATICACVAFAQPNLALGLLGQLSRARVALALLLATAITYTIGLLYYGYAWPLQYARTLVAHGSAERFSAIQITAFSIARSFGTTPQAAWLVEAGVAVLAIAAAVQIARRVDNPFARFAALSALVPFVAGFVHEHDLVVAYPAAIWCALRTHATTRALALAGTLLVCVDWLGLAQRPSGIAQSALLATAAIAAFAALGQRLQLREALVVMPAFVAIFVVATWLATQNPAPVWPAPLAAFHAPPGASVAAIWSAEQAASGLLAAVPAWAFLRALSLLGGALLAYAIYRDPSRCRTA
jgi:predicted membrane channel-forming protein YqfA (hemolysin III family)